MFDVKGTYAAELSYKDVINSLTAIMQKDDVLLEKATSERDYRKMFAIERDLSLVRARRSHLIQMHKQVLDSGMAFKAKEHSVRDLYRLYAIVGDFKID